VFDTAFNFDPIVHYVSSPCGRGKTYAACKFMRDNQFRSNHLYIAPSVTVHIPPPFRRRASRGSWAA